MKYPTAIINAVRSYTNRAFISSYQKGTIPFPVEVEGFFEIRGSEFNDGFYYGKENTFVEEVSFDGYVVHINLPLDGQTLLDIDKILATSGDKGLVRREQLDDYSYTLDTPTKMIGGIPVTHLSSLDHYRVLPGGVLKEYQNAGII